MSSNSLRGKLIDGEKVIKEWSAKDWTRIMATNYRLFLIRESKFNKQSIEAPYSEISSLEFSKRRPLERGVASLICGFLFMATLAFPGSNIRFLSFRSFNVIDALSITLLLLFIGFFIWFIIGVDCFAIHIVGRDPVHVSRELKELYYFARLHLKSSVKIPTTIQNEDLQNQDLPQKYVRNA